jgi:hypothetical protein
VGDEFAEDMADQRKMVKDQLVPAVPGSDLPISPRGHFHGLSTHHKDDSVSHSRRDADRHGPEERTPKDDVGL